MEKECMPKLAAARNYREAHGLSFQLQVDGGIDANTAPIAVKHGANNLVAGSYCFGAEDITKSILTLREA